MQGFTEYFQCQMNYMIYIQRQNFVHWRPCTWKKYNVSDILSCTNSFWNCKMSQCKYLTTSYVVKLKGVAQIGGIWLEILDDKYWYSYVTGTLMHGTGYSFRERKGDQLTVGGSIRQFCVECSFWVGTYVHVTIAYEVWAWLTFRGSGGRGEAQAWRVLIFWMGVLFDSAHVGWVVLLDMVITYIG